MNIAYIDTDLCISAEAVASVVSISTIKHGLMNNRAGSPSWQHHIDPADARRRWIVYDSIPDASRTLLDQHFGDLSARYRRELLTERIHLHRDPQDVSFFISRFTPEQTDQLADACAWLRLLAAQDGIQHFVNQQDYYESAAQVISERKLYGLKVSNWRTLSRKVKAWQTTGRESLISAKHGNTNSAKITDLAKDWIIALYSSPLKPTIRKITELYNAEAPGRSWHVLTEERIRQIIREPRAAQRIALHRHGTSAYRAQFERTIKRRRPSFPDALWSLDGLTIQLRYQDSDGKVRSDLYAVIVHDVHSDKIVGSAEGTTETSTLVQAALRAACRNTMMLPHQLQYDNSSANTSTEVKDLMTRLARIAFPTAPYNGKSKPVENLIGRFEGHNLRYFDNFKGGNITSHSIERKANPDHLNAIDLPDRAGALAQFHLAIEVHNKTKGADGLTPDERYAVQDSRRRPMDLMMMIHAFWVERRNTCRYTKDGLIIEVDKKRYTYEVEARKGIEDMEFRKKWLGTSFTIKYDPDDLDMIALYHDEKYIAPARQKYLAPMAAVDTFDGEGEIVREQLHERSRFIQDAIDDMEKSKADLEAEGLETELDHKTMHKDAYNRIERQLQDQLIDTAQPFPRKGSASRRSTRTNVQAEPVFSLFNGDDADGSVIDPANS